MKWTKIKLTEEEIQQLNIEEYKITKPNFLNVCIETISRWLKAYALGGIEELLKWENEGKVSVLTENQKEILKTRNQEQPFENSKEAKDFIEPKFHLKLA